MTTTDIEAAILWTLAERAVTGGELLAVTRGKLFYPPENIDGTFAIWRAVEALERRGDVTVTIRDDGAKVYALGDQG